jgi:hypothetical protein
MKKLLANIASELISYVNNTFRNTKKSQYINSMFRVTTAVLNCKLDIFTADRSEV